MIREHSEAIQPPRTLWVTFELGRPLGVPNDADFQRRVVKTALDMLDINETPLIIDYSEDAPASATGADADDGEGWVCPISLPAQVKDPTQETVGDALVREVSELAPWYDLSVQKTGRTTVGSSGLEMLAAAAFITSFLDGNVPDNPVDGERVDRALKWACDDLKAYYYEAMLAQPGGPSSRDLDAWFFGETTAGFVFFSLQKVLLSSGDEAFKLVAVTFLIPRLQQHWSPLD